MAATGRLLVLGVFGFPVGAIAGPNPFLADVPQSSAAVSSVMEMDKPEQREVLVPTGFEAWRTPKEIVLKEFTSLKPVKLMVGKGRMVVATGNMFVYPAGEPRPAHPLGGGGNVYGYPPASSMSRYDFDFLQPGKPFTVELEIFIIEIHESSGHLMIPGGGKDKIIWQKTFRLTPKETARLPAKVEREMNGAPDHAVLPPPPPPTK